MATDGRGCGWTLEGIIKFDFRNIVFRQHSNLTCHPVPSETCLRGVDNRSQGLVIISLLNPEYLVIYIVL